MLNLTPLCADDADALFEVQSDPQTWLHLPVGRHVRRQQSLWLCNRAAESWQAVGLGPWAVRASATMGGFATGMFFGSGGVAITTIGVWNLGYRLAPASWGHGFATQICRAACDAAKACAPQRAVTARVLSNNPASIAVAVKAGLTLLWEGATSAPAAEGVTGQIYSGRALSGAELDWLIREV